MSYATSTTPPSAMRSCCVLLSGGQDSSTCLALAKATGQPCIAVAFDYGQRHRIELEAARAVAAELAVPLAVIHLGIDGGGALQDDGVIDAPSTFDSALPATFMPGRNALFLAAAATWALAREIDTLVLGVSSTDYSGYPDCRLPFISSMHRALNWSIGADPAFGGRVHLWTPLLHKSKAETVQLAETLGALSLMAKTHTCYAGTVPACGECPACVLRLRGFAQAGLVDLIPYAQKEIG